MKWAVRGCRGCQSCLLLILVVVLRDTYCVLNDPEMNVRSFIGKIITVEIDRPLGSKHPQHDLVYEVNYGFVPSVIAPDGEFLDVYVLGLSEPVSQFEGECIAVLHRLNDEDDKLIVIPAGMRYTDEQIRAQTKFQEQFFQSIILRS